MASGNLEKLPKTVQQIADVIGRRAALRLVAQLPRSFSKGHPSGQPILYIPKSLSSDHPLEKMLGLADATLIVQAFGGEILFPAAGVSVVRQARNREVIRLLKEGWNEHDVANTFRLTVRQIRNLRKESAPEEQALRSMQSVA